MSIDYTTAEVARILNLSDSSLRSCLRAACLPLPSRRRSVRCTFQDLLLLKTTKNLLAAKIPLAHIRRILQSLKRQLPEDLHICNLTIYADGRRVIAWDGTAHWQPDSGQFLFNFEPQTLAQAVDLPHRARTPAPTGRTAAQWFDLAVELEQHSPEEAGHAYREALKLAPALVDAHINLGRLYYESQRFDQAEASYRAALEHAPDSALAHFNLAILLEARGQRANAIRSYVAALERDAGFFEAQYNLALMYESENRRADAIRHFSAAHKLVKSQLSSRLRHRNKPRTNPYPPRHSV